MSKKAETSLRLRIKKVFEQAGWACFPYAASMHGQRGVPDYLCCAKPGGKFVGIEVKVPGEEPEPHQHATHRLVFAAEGTVLVIDSTRKAKDFLKQWVDNGHF